MKTSSAILTLLVAAALTACSKPAEPLTTTQTAQPSTAAPAAPMPAPAMAPGSALPPGHPPMGQGPMGQGPMGQAPMGQMPAGHPPMGQMPAGHPPAGQAPAGQAGPATAGGLTWTAAEPLTARPPASQMRAAEYAVSGDAGEAVLTVFYFGPGQGGSIDGNVERWVNQVSQPDGKASMDVAKVTKLEVAGMPITRVDVSGTFGGGMAPMMGQQAAPQANQRVLGAIVEGKQGPVFFKMTGPAATVEKAEKAFDGLVASVKAQ